MDSEEKLTYDEKEKSSIIAVLLSASMLVLPVVPAAAAVPDTDIEVNGHEIDFTSRLPLIQKELHMHLKGICSKHSMQHSFNPIRQEQLPYLWIMNS